MSAYGTPFPAQFAGYLFLGINDPKQGALSIVTYDKLDTSSLYRTGHLDL